MVAHRAAVRAGRLLLAASMVAFYAGGAGNARGQQVIDHQQPLLTLFTHGVTLTHHVVWNRLCLCGDFDSHRFVERQITVFPDGTLRSVDAFQELEQAAPAFASSVTGKGTPQTFAALSYAVAAANPAAQTGNCSFPTILEQTDSIYNLKIVINHSGYLTWLAAGNDQRVEIALNSQGPNCSLALQTALDTILNYEQEVIALNPHVPAGS